ncbi:TerC family protein [Paenibacillus alvei]|uniref:TerC family protein n=1 Tax=Paenibacillus alvei TaxID=44250 RepID=UPI0022824E55|nr:TerC family protein [Paenibacillus alvei]MCY7487005.1 TerC family protein [Paenibacillus alvei]
MESFWLLAEIMLINLVLSGDNAVVIAMTSRRLPKHEQQQAIWWGAAGAVILRVLLTVAALWLMNIPLLKAAGGVMLFVIAVQLLAEQEHIDPRQSEAHSLWAAVRIILLADVVMSLDNVLAIAAVAKGNMAFVAIGIALSIPIIVWGSGFISTWLQKLPLLLYAGAGILGYTAGEMIASDERLALWLPAMWNKLHFGLPWIVLALVVVLGFAFRRQIRY